ncbi:MAG: tripartite tricarboxylate transporter TctB family protein [Shinella sp.]
MPSFIGHPDKPDRFATWLGIGFSGLLLASGVFMAISAPTLRLFSTTGPGSGFLPLIIGLALVVVAALFLIQRVVELRERSTAEAMDNAHAAIASVDETIEGDAPAPMPEAGLTRAGLIIVSLILLASTLEYLGFQLSMFFFLLFHLRVLGKRSWVTTLIMAAVGSFLVFALFSGLLRVTLPRSDIPFLESLGL